MQQATVDEAFRNQIGGLDFPVDLSTSDLAPSCGFQADPGYQDVR